MADCCAALATIEKHCGPNAAGLKRQLYIACQDDIDVIPAAVDHVITTDLTMVATKVFSVFNIDKSDQSFVAEVDENGIVKITVGAFIPRMQADKSNVLNATLNGEFILILTDKNGQRLILGDKEDGISLQVKAQTNDKNGYVLTFTMDAAQLPYFYTGAIPV